MARSTRTSLAGQAANAARRIVKRRPAATAEEAAPSGAAATKKASTKKAPAKRAPAKKAPAGRTSVTKAPVKAAPAKKAAVKQTAATGSTAKAAPAKKTPAKKTSAKKASTVADKTPAKKTAVKKDPAKKAPAKKAPAEKAPATRAPAKKAAAAKSPAAKTPAKKAPVSALVVKEDEEAWTKEELAEVLTELHEQREHSAGIVAAQEAELSGLMRDSGDGAGHDQADLGATSFERDHELTVLNNERDKLAQIERALLRIDDGSYGRCESCGNPIGKMRLMAFPRATLCMTCKQREERR